VDLSDGPFDVLGEHVAAGDDDDVLDAAADDQLAVDEVGEVAGAQPAVVESGRRGLRVLVVAGRDRRAADLELAGPPISHRRAGEGIADAQLEPGYGPPEARQVT